MARNSFFFYKQILLVQFQVILHTKMAMLRLQRSHQTLI